MLLKTEREKIVSICNKMLKEGYTNGTSGNVSIYNRKENLVALSPTGIPYDVLTAEDVSVVKLDGTLLEGKKATSELDLHCIFYKNRDDVSACLHAHTVYSTTVACLRKSLPAIDYMIMAAGDKEVRCTEYATFGTKELAENAFKTMGEAKAVLLANHGIVTVADDIDGAYGILVQIEYISQLYILSKQTGMEPAVLDDTEMIKMKELFKTYGQVKK